MLNLLRFRQKNPVFRLPSGSTVSVNSLCGTRTFFYLSRVCDIKFIGYPKTANFCIIGPESKRLLSAYNKKVLAANCSFPKQLLLLSTGLKSRISFEELMWILCCRKNRGQFIDRHFKPCYQNGQPIMTTQISFFLAEHGVDQTYLNIKVKSSFHVSGHDPLFLSDLTPFQHSLIASYLSI